MKDKERRPNKRFKMKENKKYPYKKTRLSRSVNQYDKYAIIDQDGNVIAKFRLKMTATEYIKHNQLFDCKVEVKAE